jgi:hypothetical protein
VVATLAPDSTRYYSAAPKAKIAAAFLVLIRKATGGTSAKP